MRAPLIAALLVSVLAAGAVGQAADDRLWVQHSFPLAGEPLVMVVDGLDAGEEVLLVLEDAVEAPPSVVQYMNDDGAPQRLMSWPVNEPGSLTSVWQADRQGRLILTIPLTDIDDVDREVSLVVQRRLDTIVPRPVAELSLHVQAPTLVLPTTDGLARIDLAYGIERLPAIPDAGGLQGLGLSADGVLGYVLRDAGLLEVREARAWDGLPIDAIANAPETDTLAWSVGGGAAFLLSRPNGTPFTPAARMVFLDDERAPLLLEPMGTPVAGRRVAVTPDGLTAYLAEDDLIVREVDLASGTPTGLIAAGLAGDREITDMLLDGRRLLIATRGPLGRNGAITSWSLDTGRAQTTPLATDPLRLVPLGMDRVLVVPANGGIAQLVEQGLPGALIAAPAGRWLDATGVPGGALMLAGLDDGTRRLERYELGSGALIPVATTPPTELPRVDRLVSHGGELVVLLGDPSGAVHVLRPRTGRSSVLRGLTALPGGEFVVLP
ncbi:MAG: hypothetical protein ACYTCU_02430 [Planctomycetota bacterium]|jgi:hypothetical protein